MIGWALTALSLIGAWYNSKADIKGFYLWIIANAGWMVWHGYHGNWPSAFLFTAYFCITVNGIRVWRKHEQHRD